MLVEHFITHLNTPSANTAIAYTADVNRFLAYLESVNCSLEDCTAFIIEGYMQYLNATAKTGKPLAPASMSRRLTVVSSYLDYLCARTNGAIRNHARDVRRPKVRNSAHRAIDPNTQDLLLNGIDNIRDKALIALYVASGLRLEEARQLDISSLSRQRRQFADGTVRSLGTGHVRGKGGKIRQFFIDEDTFNLVRTYLRVRGHHDNPALFLSNRMTRLSRRNIQYILDRWCRRLGIPHAHIHALRHTFATNAVNNGMSSLVLQELMAHSSLTVTQRYFSIRPERVATEYFAVQESRNRASNQE